MYDQKRFGLDFTQISILARYFLISSISGSPQIYLNDLEDILSFVTPTFDVVFCLGDFNVDFLM